MKQSKVVIMKKYLLFWKINIITLLLFKIKNIYYGVLKNITNVFITFISMVLFLI